MAGMMQTRVELRISCQDLPSADIASKSDPLVVVKLRDDKGKFYEIGRTEKIRNESDPQFATPIQLDYKFEEIQCVKFSVYDIDHDSETTDDDDSLGKALLTLGNIVAAKSVTTKLSKSGTITVTASEVTNTNEIEMTIAGMGLDKKDMFGKSDPFLEFYKRTGDNWTLVHRTEVEKNTLNPRWKKCSVSIHSLCDGDFNRQFQVRCFDHDNTDDHDLIGQFETSLAQVLGLERTTFELVNPKKAAKKKNYKNSGQLVFNDPKVVECYSFLDYVMGGCNIHFTCGIDFTGSNGNPAEPNSLHYCGSTNPNQYAQALQAIGYVIQDYDTDHLFPAFGFGAKIPPENEVSHEFALNFNPTNPYCQGISGVLEAYYSAIRTVKLWGPTNFAPIINHVARFASDPNLDAQASQYFVLMIVTDGVVTDIEQTISAIVRASYLPMSIIIVGVGNADFTAMEFLDGDGGVLRCLGDGRVLESARDIVQFVPFRKYKMASAAKLASCVLAEVPRQLVSYYKMKALTPHNRVRQTPAT